MLPMHGPDPCADRAGAHCLWYPLGRNTVGVLQPPRHPPCPSSSGDETSISSTAYSNSALSLLRVKGIWDLETTLFPSSQPIQIQIKMILPL